MTDYNGWTNKETWLVNLWLGDSLAISQEVGEEITADYIKQFVDECISTSVSAQFNDGFIVDLLNCALGEINYHEIAKHYASDPAAE